MKIGFAAAQSEFTDALYATLETKLTAGELVRLKPEETTAEPVEVLLTLGPVTRAMLEAMPKLQLLHVLSDGYETVDVDAASELGIWVTYSPGSVTGNADAVAEFAVLLMLAAARKLAISRASLGDSGVTKPRNTMTLLQKVVCVVGPGTIGAKIAARLLPFGVRLTAVARDPLHAPKGIPTRPMKELKDAVAEADFVVLAVRATDETRHMIDAGVLAAMKKGSILVNIARGSLVDEQALYDAVASGHLSGAGLDVLEQEPVRADEPLLKLPQIFITPHVAGQTELVTTGTAAYIAEVVENLKEGKRMDALLNQPKMPRLPLRAGKV